MLLLSLNVPTAPAAFDDGFIGARAMAMGGVSAAIGSDADSLLINPATLSNLPDGQDPAYQQLLATTAVLHAELSDGTSITQNLLGYINKRTSPAALGVLWKRLNVSKLYSENYVVVGISRSFALGERRLSFGGDVKFLNWDTAPTIGANGIIVEDLPGRSLFSFDVGLVFRPSANIPIALSVQNINTPNIATRDSPVTENLPIWVTLGLGVFGQRSLWGMDVTFREREVDVKVGLEQTFNQGKFRLRGGFRLESLAWGTNLTLGGGYHVSERLRLDYAFLFPIGGIEETLGSHRFSVVYDF